MDVYQTVLSHQKIKQYLKEQPTDESKIRKIIDEIRGDYSSKIVGFAAYLIDKTFRKLYDGFYFDKPSRLNLKAAQKDHHVILVPNHQSHADYIAMQYIMYKDSRTPVYIAGGVNLNIFPIGSLFRKSGAFFIRRKFDDKLYKIVFQAYIYYLLKTDRIVEFFFEGGRTRSGKLRPPRYGLFSILLETMRDYEGLKPLMFVPVSICHEMIPEANAHVKEMKGSEKKQEKTSQLFKIFKLFNKKLGSIHVRFNEGIVVSDFDDLKLQTRDLAFECFRRVGQGMAVTPSSLLALVLLDNPSGALTWQQLLGKSKHVLRYCEAFNIPIGDNLKELKLEESLKVSLDMFINNGNIEIIKKEKLGRIYYKMSPSKRAHMLYQKNMIIHHFLLPSIMNMALEQVQSKKIITEKELLRYILEKRRELKHEFYLPQVKPMLKQALEILKYGIGKDFDSLGSVMSVSEQEKKKLIFLISPFSSALSYIYEGYLLAAKTVQYFGDSSFNELMFIKISKEIFDLELEHGRLIKYPESYNIQVMKNALKLFVSKALIEQKGEFYQCKKLDKVQMVIREITMSLNDQFNRQVQDANF